MSLQVNITKATMATVEMKFPVLGCDMGEGVPYKTEKVEREMAWGLMQMHSAIPSKQAQLAPRQNVSSVLF